MSSSQSAAPGAKRKKPPTFVHLPEYKAKSLKKAWVEKTKIKSQWKAQKRKEDLASKAKLELPTYDEEENGARMDDEQEAGPSTAKAPYVHPSRAHIHPDEPVNQSRARPPPKQPQSDDDEEEKEDAETDTRPHKKRKRSDAEAGPTTRTADAAQSDAVQSLRELKREAYSASSLHTFKSDPLKKKRHQGPPAQRGRGAPAAAHRGRGGGGRGGQPATGRGQPNMKLRMNAMLAEIKQSLA